MAQAYTLLLQMAQAYTLLRMSEEVTTPKFRLYRCYVFPFSVTQDGFRCFEVLSNQMLYHKLLQDLATRFFPRSAVAVVVAVAAVVVVVVVVRVLIFGIRMIVVVMFNGMFFDNILFASRAVRP